MGDEARSEMTSGRKKPTAGFWITVALVAVLLGYPLSFGPVCWMLRPANGSDARPLVAVYKPLISATRYPRWQWSRDAICWYGGDYGTLVYLVAVLNSR